MAKKNTPAKPKKGLLVARVATPEQFQRLAALGVNSVFAIASRSVDDLLALDKELNVVEARALHQQATAMAVVVARQWREARLTGQTPVAQQYRTGVRALVEGPTFESQFNPSWAANSLPGAIEATTSPAAYLVDLYRLAKRIEAKGVADEIIPLDVRRPDLATMILDQVSLDRVEPTVGIVNEILTQAARKFLDDNNRRDVEVDDVLLDTRYPFKLPYERYQAQINNVLQRKGQALGDVVRHLDPQFPYFAQAGLHSLRSDDALQLDGAMGPEQRMLLLEAPYFPLGSTTSRRRVNPRTLLRESVADVQSDFYHRHYGVATREALMRTDVFCHRTGLTQGELESLLSIETRAPLASTNISGIAPASPARFGSVYVNAGREPVLGVSSEGGEMHTFLDATDGHLDRMQRMIRLARWLELPFDQVDLLLVAALRAEHGQASHDYQISENTLRALGLFRRLRRDFKVTAEDFAALIDGFAIYGRGSEMSQFDRIFNNDALFQSPFVLDGREFPIVPVTDAQYQKIRQLCAVLGVTFETYVYVARFIAQAQYGADSVNQETLHWTREVASAFYRMVKLPGYLRLSTVEAIALLELVNQRGNQYVTRLMLPAVGVYQHSDTTDTMSVIQSLADVAQWCQSSGFTVSWLYQQLMPLSPAAAATEHEINLFKQLYARIQLALVTEESFLEAGAPASSGGDSPTTIFWLKEFEPFISAQGLLLQLSYPDAEAGMASEYETALLQCIDVLIPRLQLATVPDLRINLFKRVMDARAAQHSLVWECLADFLQVTAEQGRELLVWALGSPYHLLSEVLRVFAAQRDADMPLPVGDQVLTTLARLARRAAITQQLGLSAEALRCFVGFPKWFGLRQQSRTKAGTPWSVDDIDFAQVYLLSQYQRVVQFAQNAEQRLLDYLRLVHELPPALSPADMEMIREDAASKIATFTGFSVRDILETAWQTTETGLITNIRELAHLIRIREFCQTLQIGTAAAVALSELTSNSPRAQYRDAAEGALSSLNAVLTGMAAQEQGELGQSETSWAMADQTLLVANSRQSTRLVLTVRNFLDQPMSGITVTWKTSLGELQTPETRTTDARGEVSIRLNAGDKMGTAQVVAAYGLDRQIMAPLVSIDCDDATLDTYVEPGYPQPQEALAGNKEEVAFAVKLVDGYGNPGRDRIVQWSTDLGAFPRAQTRTDDEGLSSASLLSRSPGEAQVIVSYAYNQNEVSFDPVTFLDQPYFQYVRFQTYVAVGTPAILTCRVVQLDESPLEAVEVTWSADVGNFAGETAVTRTNSEGIATIEYVAQTEGVVTIRVNASVTDQVLRELASAPETVYLFPQIVEHSPLHQYANVDRFDLTNFSVTLEPARAGYPVEWTLQQDEAYVSHTDGGGVARFDHRFMGYPAGMQVLTASTVGIDNTLRFEIELVRSHDRIEFSLVPTAGISLLEWAGSEDSFVISRGSVGVLAIRVMGDSGGDEDAWVQLSLESGSNMGIELALGERLYTDEDGLIQLEINASAASFSAAGDTVGNCLEVIAVSNHGVINTFSLHLRDVARVHAVYVATFDESTAMLGGLLVNSAGGGFEGGQGTIGTGESVITALQFIEGDLVFNFPEVALGADSNAVHLLKIINNPRVCFCSGNTAMVESLIRVPAESIFPASNMRVVCEALDEWGCAGDRQNVAEGFYVARKYQAGCKMRLLSGEMPLQGFDLLGAIHGDRHGVSISARSGFTDQYGYQILDFDATLAEFQPFENGSNLNVLCFALRPGVGESSLLNVYLRFFLDVYLTRYSDIKYGMIRSTHGSTIERIVGYDGISLASINWLRPVEVRYDFPRFDLSALTASAPFRIAGIYRSRYFLKEDSINYWG